MQRQETTNQRRQPSVTGQFWGNPHTVYGENAEEKLRKIKNDEDLKVVKHFDRLYKHFQHESGHRRPGDYVEQDESESDHEEATDIMEILNKELEKINAGGGRVPGKAAKKLNPYAQAQAEYKKSRVINKRLNTLSIFVKKDVEINKHQNAIFDEDERETANHGQKNGSRK